MNQNSTGPSGSVETLADVPEHILKGLPEEVRLLPSTVDKTRLGVWAAKPIFRGRKFGPFVGDKKKRSQVKSNVYMWEVYYPNLGWMCVDATDPAKGNWLRYVNWARSGKEQNLFPLEINRSIYYKTLKDSKDGGLLKPQMSGHNGRHPDRSCFRYHNSSAVGHVVSKVTSLVKLLSATVCVLGAGSGPWRVVFRNGLTRARPWPASVSLCKCLFAGVWMLPSSLSDA